MPGGGQARAGVRHRARHDPDRNQPLFRGRASPSLAVKQNNQLKRRMMMNVPTSSTPSMLCPVCRVALSMSERQGVEIDFCPQCRGVWLDRGELDKIIERSESAAPSRSD